MVDGDDADLGTHDAAIEVVGGNMDATVETGESRLVGGVAVGGPLQRDGSGRAGFVDESAGFDSVGGEPAGEVWGAGEFGEDFGGGSAEAGMSADVSGKCGADE